MSRTSRFFSLENIEESILNNYVFRIYNPTVSCVIGINTAKYSGGYTKQFLSAKIYIDATECRIVPLFDRYLKHRHLYMFV